MTDVITKHLDVWTSALMNKSTAGRCSNGKQTAYGITKLRELILELAVRGKLVPQDPNDEPAIEILKRIHKDKSQQLKKLSVIGGNELGFQLPTGWTTARFGDVFALEYGNNLPAEKRSNTGEYPVYGSNGIVGTHNQCFVDSPCIVIGRKGSAGALNLSQSVGCCVTDVSYYCIPPKGLDLTFTFKLFHTLGLDSLGKGIKPGLNRNEAYILPIAIPPLTEQHRIIVKVDELMALCDQLEQQQTDNIAVHQTLVEILLGMLTQATDAQAFAETWSRIAEHFDTLFTTEHSIDQLKQTILQLAVMGKLVPQDPKDEPASILLETIFKQRMLLAQDGKLRKQNPLPKITDEEKPFELPIGWEFVRFGDVVFNRDAERIPLSVEERQGRRGDYDYYGASGVIDSIDDYLFDKPLLLIGEDGANLINRSTPIAFMARGKYWVNNHAHVLDGLTEDLLLFICLHINAISLEPYITGTAQPKMNQAKMNSIVLALPPLEEQKRIVAKVDELMALSNALKARINQAQTTQIHLADAIVEQAVA